LSDYNLISSDEERLRATVLHHLVGNWAETATGTVVNRPSSEATNHSKLFQALAIRACGFSFPDSIVTNDVSRIREFQREHGRLVYKSLSGVRSIVTEFSEDQILGRRIGPAFLQQHIQGWEVRVHVVGKQTFSCRVRSTVTDYRYSFSTSLEAFTLPVDVSERCVALSDRLGLLLAGIDLMVTADGEWFCLEVNPNPGFSYYDVSNHDIAKALAELLISGVEQSANCHEDSEFAVGCVSETLQDAGDGARRTPARS
jgi:glutathione synthase/RimK-type ligase-like ATP-grasp enzyme